MFFSSLLSLYRDGVVGGLSTHCYHFFVQMILPSMRVVLLRALFLTRLPFLSRGLWQKPQTVIIKYSTSTVRSSCSSSFELDGASVTSFPLHFISAGVRYFFFSYYHKPHHNCLSPQSIFHHTLDKPTHSLQSFSFHLVFLTALHITPHTPSLPTSS